MEHLLHLPLSSNDISPRISNELRLKVEGLCVGMS